MQCAIGLHDKSAVRRPSQADGSLADGERGADGARGEDENVARISLARGSAMGECGEVACNGEVDVEGMGTGGREVHRQGGEQKEP